MRFLILTIVFLGSTFLIAAAQSPATSVPGLAVSDLAIARSANETVRVTHLVPESLHTLVVMAPGGGEEAIDVRPDGNGAFVTTLAPPGGLWQAGLYRLVLELTGGVSVSTTFAASDGQPRIAAGPYMPSPTSALMFSGTGFQPNSRLALILLLTGGQQGGRPIPVITDAGGSFSVFVWPQYFGLLFFAAGAYRVQTDTGLATDFQVREHPMGAAISVPTTLIAGAPMLVHLRSYAPRRFVWGLYVNSDGREAGEFLIGPTDPAGNFDALVAIPSLAAGVYYLGSPYDWGESSFTILAPTPTTTPTAAATATPTAAPNLPRKKHRRRHKKHGKPF